MTCLSWLLKRASLAVTPGEPAGVGPEIVLKLLREHPGFRPGGRGGPGSCSEAGGRTRRTGFRSESHSLAAWRQSSAPAALACLPRTHAQAFGPSRANRMPAMHGYVLEHAAAGQSRLVDDRRGGGPGDRAGAQGRSSTKAGFAFSGHTEFLGELARDTPQVVMMLAAPGLRVALVTTHLPLRDVADAITAWQRWKLSSASPEAALQDNASVSTRPRLPVYSGLNPHAGEGGHLGREERRNSDRARSLRQAARPKGWILAGAGAGRHRFHPAAAGSHATPSWPCTTTRVCPCSSTWGSGAIGQHHAGICLSSVLRWTTARRWTWQVPGHGRCAASLFHAVLAADSRWPGRRNHDASTRHASGSGRTS